MLVVGGGAGCALLKESMLLSNILLASCAAFSIISSRLLNPGGNGMGSTCGTGGRLDVIVGMVVVGRWKEDRSVSGILGPSIISVGSRCFW